MKHMPEERIRRTMSVGKEREDDGKYMKYELEERMRGGTSGGKTGGTSISREMEDDGKHLTYVPKERMRKGTSV